MLKRFLNDIRLEFLECPLVRYNSLVVYLFVFFVIFKTTSSQQPFPLVNSIFF